MLIVMSKGGLGNQISQYAFSRLLQKKYPDISVKIDLSWHLITGVEFELPLAFERSSLNYAIATKDETEKAAGLWNYGAIKTHITDKVRNKAAKIFSGNMIHIVREPLIDGYPVELNQLDIEQDWVLDGTWWSQPYMSILSELQSELQFRRSPAAQYYKWEKEIKSTKAVSLHIRKGDFSGTSRDILPESNYYKNAIQHIQEQIGKDITVFVFSNDRSFANDYIQSLDMGCPFVAVDSADREAYTDMQLMSLCNANICANSTFSMWAALLGWEEGKIVTLPERLTQSRKNCKNEWSNLIAL